MRRPFACLALLMLASPAAGETVKRAAPAEILVISGAYEMSNEAGTRKCILLLRPSDAPAGQAPGGLALGFPAQCRMALPVLAKVQAWTVETMARAPRARIRLLAGDGKTQLDFTDEGPNGTAAARDSAGQVYHLKPTQGSSLATRVDSLVAVRPAPPVAYAPPPPDPAAMARAVGAYRFMRAGEVDTDCRVTLEGAAPSAVDGIARLSPACADQGITFFNPKSWNIANDTLWLVGTRGRISFERNRRGGWDKAPGQGSPLHLLKM